MIRKAYLIGRDFTAHMRKQNISAYAASIAFFFFLSLVPMLMTICTIIPYTPLTEENLVTAVTDITPDRIDPLAESLIADVYDKIGRYFIHSDFRYHMVCRKRGYGVNDGAEFRKRSGGKP